MIIITENVIYQQIGSKTFPTCLWWVTSGVVRINTHTLITRSSMLKQIMKVNIIVIIVLYSTAINENLVVDNRNAVV